MTDQPFSVYFALDGPDLDGLVGSAGMLRFDWPERKFYVQHYDGISAAHNPSLAPNGKLALLGNFGQTIMLLDISDPKMPEVARQSTMYFEECSYRLRANTHHLWYPDSERFIGAVGDHLYRFHVDDLKHPENLGPHYLENAHELRWDSQNRYILMGDLGPEKKDVRQVAVFDLAEPIPEKRSRVIKIQNNSWHCSVHPTKPIGYSLTYSLITDHDDWVNWSPGYVREYIYEIGTPWENFELWKKLAYPFLHPERITAPTLFQCAGDDDNVPCVGAQQMYQTLKTRGVPTKLIVYPGENHELDVPSYLVHRMRADIEWFDRWLK